jgi:methyl-accepting chemotaxis protein
MSTGTADTEDGGEPTAVQATADGSARYWAVVGSLANTVKSATPRAWRRTLNRQLYVHAMLATGVPVLIALFVVESLLVVTARKPTRSQ